MKRLDTSKYKFSNAREEREAGYKLRADAPLLLAEVERLQAELDAYEKALNKIISHSTSNKGAGEKILNMANFAYDVLGKHKEK